MEGSLRGLNGLFESCYTQSRPFVHCTLVAASDPAGGGAFFAASKV